MALQTINNGDSGLQARNKINENFSDECFVNTGQSLGIHRSLGNIDNYDLDILTNNISRFHIKNDGTIYFPGSSFAVGYAIDTSLTYTVEIDGDLNLSAGSKFRIGGIEFSSGGDFANGGEAGGADRTLGNTDAFNLGFLTNNLNRLQILSSGEVGIGYTTAYTSLLAVNGTASIGIGDPDGSTLFSIKNTSYTNIFSFRNIANTVKLSLSNAGLLTCDDINGDEFTFERWISAASPTYRFKSYAGSGTYWQCTVAAVTDGIEVSGPGVRFRANGHFVSMGISTQLIKVVDASSTNQIAYASSTDGVTYVKNVKIGGLNGTSAGATGGLDGSSILLKGGDGYSVAGVANGGIIELSPGIGYNGGTNGNIYADSGNTANMGIGYSTATSLTAKLQINGPILFQIDTTDVSNPPTDAELDSAFGTPATVGAGWSTYINDNGAGNNFYLVTSDGTNWWIFTGTKAV